MFRLRLLQSCRKTTWKKGTVMFLEFAEKLGQGCEARQTYQGSQLLYDIVPSEVTSGYVLSVALNDEALLLSERFDTSRRAKGHAEAFASDVAFGEYDDLLCPTSEPFDTWSYYR